MRSVSEMEIFLYAAELAGAGLAAVVPMGGLFWVVLYLTTV